MFRNPTCLTTKAINVKNSISTWINKKVLLNLFWRVVIISVCFIFRRQIIGIFLGPRFSSLDWEFWPELSICFCNNFSKTHEYNNFLKNWGFFLSERFKCRLFVKMSFSLIFIKRSGLKGWFCNLKLSLAALDKNQHFNTLDPFWTFVIFDDLGWPQTILFKKITLGASVWPF